MFSFLRQRRARSALGVVMPALVNGVQTMAPIERCACYMIAHGLLRKAAEQWGPDVLARPASLTDDVAAAIVHAMADSHAKVFAQGIEPYEERGSNDLAYAQALRQARALEAGMAIVGRRFVDKSLGAEAPKAWKLLWNANGHVNAACDLLLRYRKVSGVDAVPRLRGWKGAVTREQLYELATHLPAMFAAKKAASAPAPVAKASIRPAATKEPLAKPAAGKIASTPAARPSVKALVKTQASTAAKPSPVRAPAPKGAPAPFGRDVVAKPGNPKTGASTKTLAKPPLKAKVPPKGSL